MDSHDGIKFPLTCRYCDSHSYVFGAGAVYSVTVYALIDISVLTQDRTSDGMVIYAVVKVLFQDLKGDLYELFVGVV